MRYSQENKKECAKAHSFLIVGIESIFIQNSVGDFWVL